MVQPLLPLIGTSTMCLQCDPCVSESVGFLRINRYLKSGKCSSAVEARLLRFWEEILKYNRRIYPPPPLHMPVKETGNLQSAITADVPSPLTTSAEAGGRTLPLANNALSATAAGCCSLQRATAPSSSTSAEPYTASSPDLLSTSKYSPSDEHRLQYPDPVSVVSAKSPPLATAMPLSRVRRRALPQVASCCVGAGDAFITYTLISGKC
ncbi:BnaA09g31240D [Brassica napus]|uniref:(rape) hypothetical protein n=1 Tax=Brassica napus TaxID=3708 RepID=A0A078I4R6_BRANA|nr:unnamed protein product [Brassica napus]CDY44128.1 BnaA09g31240D [Brassica napus]